MSCSITFSKWTDIPLWQLKFCVWKREEWVLLPCFWQEWKSRVTKVGWRPTAKTEVLCYTGLDEIIKCSLYKKAVFRRERWRCSVLQGEINLHSNGQASYIRMCDVQLVDNINILVDPVPFKTNLFIFASLLIGWDNSLKTGFTLD